MKKKRKDNKRGEESQQIEEEAWEKVREMGKREEGRKGYVEQEEK